MDLWIRSQNKQGLVKVNEIWINGTNSNVISYEYGQLGLYKSKERALEVLDDINNYKDKLEKAHFLGMTESKFVSSTYEMPEK